MPEKLSSAHASLLPHDGLALYADPPALEVLARAIEGAKDVTIRLDRPPAHHVEVAAVDRVRIEHSTASLASIDYEAKAIVLSGSAAPRERLAATLRGLARTQWRGEGHEHPHVDLEHVPGDELLAERSMWMTIMLIE